MIAFKILTGSELGTFLAAGQFSVNTSDMNEGFIHLSTESQLSRVVEKYYTDIRNVYLAAVNLDSVEDEIKWEEASNGQNYPHLYGILRVRDVIFHTPLMRHPDGSLQIPNTEEMSGL